MKRLIFAVLAALAASGCAAVKTPVDDGYRIGDTTGSLLEMQARYCATADPYRRAVVLALMYRAGVTLPPNGACTDLLEVLDADRDTASSADGPGAE